MSFKNTVGMLSKSSAEAVSTLAKRTDVGQELKEFLYVETQIERTVRSELSSSTDKRIVFLCGSSGDGKSEIFRRIHTDFAGSFEFHLDATHSFDPGKNAIQTLDDRFTDFKSGSKALVVGINIGMLGNFAADGAEVHYDIKDSIKAFLTSGKGPEEGPVFINFEAYPKFELNGEEVDTPFIFPLLQRICSPVAENPIFSQWQRESGQTRAHLNYGLLCVLEVQKRICNLLFYAHLQFDQFLTARTLLDFVYQILTGKGVLFDNLFCSHGTELLHFIRKLDPSHARSRQLDLFQVKGALGLYDSEFVDFRRDIEKEFGLTMTEPRSWVRLFYMMQDVDFGNNYHHRFRNDLRRPLFDEYKSIWQLHRDHDGNDKAKRGQLREFYTKQFINAVTRFANRFAPEVRNDRFLLGKQNGYAVSADSTLQPDLSRLAKIQPNHLREFSVHLRVSQTHKVGPIPVSVNFLELARKINDGYRPNTHDKTTVVKLEELAEEIRRIVRQSDRIYIQGDGVEWELTDDSEEDEIIAERR